MTRLHRTGHLASFAAGLALVLAACAPAAQPSPTTPAKPTEAPKPAATTAPAKPAASPVAKEEAKPAASPAAKPAEAKPAASPAAQPAAKAEASPKPAAKGEPLSGTIKIVSSLPRTGGSKGQTDTMVNAIKMALEEANMRVGGATIVYEDMDDATPARGTWDAGKEAENANKAAADRDVLVYLGTYNSGAAKVSIPILNRAGPLAMISAANTYPGLTKKVEGMTEANEPDVYYPNRTRNYFRVIPTDDFQGAVGAGWAKELGARRVYILDDTETYGNGIARVFNATARRIGLEVAGGPEGIDPKASDYRALAQKIRAANADLVYLGMITQNNAGKVVQDLKSAMPQVKIMGPDGMFEQDFINSAGQAAEGTYLTFGGVPPDKLTGKGADFVKAYKDKYKQDLEAYTAYGYESAKVALQAIQTCGQKDRACVTDAMSKTRNFAGILGSWSFTDTGDTDLVQMSGNTVKGGKFEFVKTLDIPK
jgi:branched-chain amino acid transport system substrate-binding protein